MYFFGFSNIKKMDIDVMIEKARGFVFPLMTNLTKTHVSKIECKV